MIEPIGKLEQGDQPSEWQLQDRIESAGSAGVAAERGGPGDYDTSTNVI